MGYSEFAKMSFDELFHTVFSDSGRVKTCGRDACQAMIERLEEIYGVKGNFGDAELGRLDVKEAYLAAKGLLWLKPN